ncbi:membrane-targeted effector domain-containing toxin [Zooshikella sp. RANM57]|uniref:membrane-targeted effector domain-containing toxin n=1 Tax=Zooshikella sp. RANM57 TaxID=3425863 RepID=UPI003D6DDB99
MAIIPLDEFKKVAAVKFKKQGESYQQLLQRYQAYEGVKGKNSPAEYDALKLLLGEVNQYLEKHPESGRNAAIQALKTQIIERRYQVWHVQQNEQLKQELSLLAQDQQQAKKQAYNEALQLLKGIVGHSFEQPSELRQVLESRFSQQAVDYLNTLTQGVLANAKKLNTGILRAVTDTLLSPEFANLQKALDVVTLNTNSPVSEQGRFAVAQELAKFPAELLDLMKAHNISVLVTQDSITSYYQELKGVTPRGWPAGQTWDSVPGVGAFGAYRGAVIAVKLDANGKWVVPKTGDGHNAANLVLHETAHAIDRIVGEASNGGQYLSNRKSFLAAWQGDFHNLGDDYYKQGGTQAGREETFAEGIARHYEKTAQLNWKNVQTWLSNKPFDKYAQQFYDEFSASWWQKQLSNEFSAEVKAYVEQQVPELKLQEKLDFVTLRKIYQAINDAPIAGNNAPLASLNALKSSQPLLSSIAPPPPSVDNLATVWSDVPSRELLVKQAAVVGKPQGESYKALLSQLQQFWQQNGSDRINTAFKLYQQAGDYIDRHPDSKRNGAIQGLRQHLARAINKAQSDHPQTQETLARVKARLQLLQLEEGLIAAPRSGQATQLADGTRVLTSSPNAGIDSLQHLQTVFDPSLRDQELAVGREAGNKVKAQANISQAEADAITWYTKEGFQYINDMLRNDQPLTHFVKDYGISALQGLNKLANYEGTVYRALAVDDLSTLADRLTPGQLVGDKGFLSTSTSAEFAKAFRGGKGTVIYAIEGVTNGRNVTGFAQLEQAEVLLQPGSHFRVEATKLTDNNLYVVLKQADNLKAGEVVRNLATGDVLGAVINGQTTTLIDDVKKTFVDPNIAALLDIPQPGAANAGLGNTPLTGDLPPPPPVTTDNESALVEAASHRKLDITEKAKYVATIYNRLANGVTTDDAYGVITPGFERPTETALAQLNETILTKAKKAIAESIDKTLGTLRGQQHSVPESLNAQVRDELASLFVEATVKQDYDLRAALIAKVEALGIPFEAKGQGEKLLAFWSGEWHGYEYVLNQKLGAEGKAIAVDHHVSGIEFLHQLRNSLDHFATDLRDKPTLKNLFQQGSRTLAGYLSSVYATGAQGTTYVLSEGGIQLNNYFWNVELPVLRKMQRDGILQDIKILFEKFESYVDKPLSEIGVAVSNKDVPVKVQLQRLPEHLQSWAIVNDFKKFADGQLTPALVALHQAAKRYIDLHPSSKRIPAVKALLQSVSSQLISLNELASKPLADQLTFVKQFAQKTSINNGFPEILSLADFSTKASVIGKPKGEGYQSVLTALAALHSQASKTALPGDRTLIDLGLNGDFINHHADNLRHQLLPFNLLRETWGVKVNHDITNGQVAITLADGRQVNVQVDVAGNQRQQLATLQRFILANYDQTSIPSGLALAGDQIKQISDADSIVLATRTEGQWQLTAKSSVAFPHENYQAYRFAVAQDKLARQIQSGVYEYQDSRVSHVVKIDDTYYAAKFDKDNNTWRLVDSTNTAKPGVAVHLDDGQWQLNLKVGLAGGRSANTTDSADSFTRQSQWVATLSDQLNQLSGDIHFKASTFTQFDTARQPAIDKANTLLATQHPVWLDTFNHFAELNNEQALGQLSETDQRQLSSYLEQLVQLSAAAEEKHLFSGGQSQSVTDFVGSLQQQDNRSNATYVLSVADQHVLIQVHDANGEVRISLSGTALGQVSGIQNYGQLQQALTIYLDTLSDSQQQSYDQFKVESVNAEQVTQLGETQPAFSTALRGSIPGTEQLLKGLDNTQGLLQLGELHISRVMLHELGATVDGKPVDVNTDFADAELASKLQLSEGKLQAYLAHSHEGGAQDTQTVSQLITWVKQQRSQSGNTSPAVVEQGLPDHWLRDQLAQLASNRYAFEQGKQLVEVAKLNHLSVELAPSTSHKPQAALANVLATARAQQLDAGVETLLANQNRINFLQTTQQQGRATSAETESLTQLLSTQDALVKAYQSAPSFKQSLGYLSIRDIVRQVSGTADKTLTLRSGKYHYLVSQQKGKLSFYDPAVGWISGFNSTDGLQQFLTNYFSDSARLQLGTATSAFQTHEIAPQFLNNEHVASLTDTLRTAAPVELDRLAQLDLQQGPVKLGEQSISRVKLWQLGAKAEGQSLSSLNFQGDWASSVRFDGQLLQAHLSTNPPSDFIDSVKLLKTIAQQRNSDISSVVDGVESSSFKQVITSLEGDSPLSSQQIHQLQRKIAGPRINIGTIKHIASQTPGVALQVWGIYSGIKSAVDAFKKGDTQEGLIQTGAVAANLASIPAEIALNRTLPKLGQRLTARLAGSGSRFAAASSNLGKLLGRAGGLGAALITLPFDIYSAYKAFSDAGKEGLTDKQRQDLYVQGGFSVAGAAVSLSLGVAALATGSAALGPIGIGLSVALIVGSQIYSAVRQVEDVWEYVPALDNWQHRLRQGWLAFTGQEMDQWVLDAYKVNKTKEMYLEQAKSNAEELLKGELGNLVDTIVYGDVDVVIQENKVYNANGYDIVRDPVVKGDEDVIFAQDGINALLATEQREGIRPTLTVQGEQDDKKGVFFNIGDGHDTVFGVTNKKNEFLFGKGNKNLKGGKLDDNFTFAAGHSLLKNFVNNPDKLNDRIFFEIDGGEGQNTLILNAETYYKYDLERQYTGFIVDLNQGKVWLRKSGESGEAARGPEIGLLRNIQHTLGASQGSDIIYGNDQSNRLLANNGDQVFAGGGSDIITVTDRATVDGGRGQDIYLVQNDASNVVIHEDGADVSVIRLEFSLDEITDWQLIEGDLRIGLQDQFKSVTIKGVYQRSNNQWQLVNDKLNFQTRDGFMLVPQLDKTRTTEAAQQLTSIQLAVRYLKPGDKTYFAEKTGVTIDLGENRIDGNNQGGIQQADEFVGKDDPSVIVADSQHSAIEGKPAGQRYLITRGAGDITIKPEAQSDDNAVINTLLLDYDESEIKGIDIQYEVEHYGYGYYRKNYTLVVTFQDGRELLLPNVIDKTIHVGDALARGGKTLRDYRLITRDGIALSLQDYSISGSRYSTKLFHHEGHYADKTKEGIKRVNTRDLLERKDYTLTDWQWGKGKTLAERYVLSGEGTFFADHIIGSDKNDLIRGYGGDDLLQGKDGHDTYVVGALEGTVTIDNRATDNKLDSLVIAASFNDIKSHRENNDLVISARLPRPDGKGNTVYIDRKIVLQNYFVSEVFRHLTIVSNEGHQQEWVVDEFGNLSRIITGKQSAADHYLSDTLATLEKDQPQLADKNNYQNHEIALNHVVDADKLSATRFVGSQHDDHIILKTAGQLNKLQMDGPKVIYNIDLGEGNNTIDLSQFFKKGVYVSLMGPAGISYNTEAYELKPTDILNETIRVNNVVNIMGTDGNDDLRGNNGGNLLAGGDGEDTIDGKEGRNILIGGAGNDTIYSGSHQDLIIFSRGDGHDSIAGNTVNDVIEINGYSLNDLHFSLTSENQLKVTFNGEEHDGITIAHWSSNWNLVIKTEDGVINKAGIDTLIPLFSEVDAQKWAAGQIAVNSSQEKALHSAWQLTRFTLQGDDDHASVLTGQQGNEEFIAGNGGTVIRAGAGDDELTDGVGNDVLIAETGDDLITFNRAGEDVASGGEGDDIYRVTSSSQGIKVIDNLAEIGEDILVLEQAKGLADIQLAKNGLDLHILLKDATGKVNTKDLPEIIIKNYYLSEKHRHLDLVLENIDVSHAELYGLAKLALKRKDVLSNNSINGAQSTDINPLHNSDRPLAVSLNGELMDGPIFKGSKYADYVKLTKVGHLQELNLGQGDNTLDLSDLVVDGNTSVVLLPESHPYQRLHVNGKEIQLHGVQRVIGSAADDNLYGNESANILHGGMGNDRLFGLKNSNTLIGGKGDDYIRSGQDQDTIIFEQGDGHDQVVGDTTGDVIKLKGVNAYDVHFSMEGNALEIGFKGQQNDKITIADWNQNQGLYITTDDGSVLDKQGIGQLVQAMASLPSDSWSASTPITDEIKATMTQAWTIAKS